MSWGVEDLTVRYGTTVALDRVDVSVEPGSVSAVVGGDGAGKSTLLRACTGLVTPDRGAVRRPAPTRVGAMMGTVGVWGDLTVDEHLAFTADAYGVTGSGERSADLLRRARLVDARDRLAADLSGGMRQKLAVILTLLHGPDLLVLDEPTTGLDPVSRAELWRLLGHAAAEGAAVLLATTYLDEAERAAHVLVLHEGRAVLAGAPEEVTGGARLEDVVIARQRELETGART